jgi:ABC-type lipoprotein export system ATPase subunit
VGKGNSNVDQTNPVNDYAVETSDLWRVYHIGANQKVEALRGIDLQIETKQLVALNGRSGSGKTTLLNCIGSLDQPTSGSITIFGQLIARLSEKSLTLWRRDQIGFIFQSFGLLPTLSAYENVELTMRIAGCSGKHRSQRTWECLELVGLTRWALHRPYELSGGQQQRVAIARALANRPRLILADEPTGELDSATAQEILSLFRIIVETEGVTLLIASHDSLVNKYADRVIRLNDGQVFDTIP